jgi:hypothetical protein
MAERLTTIHLFAARASHDLILCCRRAAKSPFAALMVKQASDMSLSASLRDLQRSSTLPGQGDR